MREAEDGKQQIRFGRLGCVVVGTGKRKGQQITARSDALNLAGWMNRMSE